MPDRNGGELTFKPEGGDGTEEGSLSPSRKGDHSEGVPVQDTPGVKCQTQTPFLNPDPFTQWYGIKN